MNDKLPCFFSLYTRADAAQHVASRLSPVAASDIIGVDLMSVDFSYDVEALNGLDNIVDLIQKHLSQSNKEEQFNPIFIPSDIEKLDSVLDAEDRGDSLKFTGLDGNAYTIKLVNITKDEENLITAKAQYHPFQLPSYSEIIERHEHRQLN